MNDKTCWVALACLQGLLAGAAEFPEFAVKREPVFEFARKPVVTRNGDAITIAFESKAFCDATVAIEGADGRIVRHLASGVLGAKAPDPFQKNSKQQSIVWDGKDDQGIYVDNKDAITVRVSLGLKPQFEKTLFWSPHKRIGSAHSPIICAGPEGVYVSEGKGIDSLRLYDHDGNYLRTVYPFPAAKLQSIRDLNWKEFPQDGQKLPIKAGGSTHATLLTSGASGADWKGSKGGAAAEAVAVNHSAGSGQAVRIALVGNRLNRLAADGSTGGLNLNGPETAIEIKNDQGKSEQVLPRSAAFSPDGQWLYLAGFTYMGGRSSQDQRWIHGVLRLRFEGNDKPELFLGSLNPGEAGQDDTHFNVPASVACDREGRIHVGDYMNDRIMVYSPEKKLLKSIKVEKPGQVVIHQKTQEIYVFSWFMMNPGLYKFERGIKPWLIHLGTMDEPKEKARHPISLSNYSEKAASDYTGMQYRFELDSWSEPATAWVVPDKLYTVGGWGVTSDKEELKGTGITLLREKDGKMAVRRDFHSDTVKSVARAKPPVLTRQRLYVNPVNGKLYSAEGDGGVMKSFRQLVEIDPDTGRIKLVNLPMSAEDMAIGLDGNFYLRSDFEVGRFDPVSWREIPWDYGEERKAAGFDTPKASLMGALPLPGTGRYPCWWHMGGMAINAKGQLAVVTCNFPSQGQMTTDENPYVKRGQMPTGGKPYTPTLYPGRVTGYETHVWDSHGKLIYEDAIPGFSTCDGIGLDKDANIYILAAMNRIVDGKPYFLGWNETLVKMPPKKGKVICTSDRIPVKIGSEADLKGPADGQMWKAGKARVEGAEWFYGGVGLTDLPCICWNARPALDFFARSFVPEIDHYSVAVLDTAGNLILRVGKFGNVDDGKPLDAAGGPPNPRSIGGDEVALFNAAYLGTHSDRRLFIADGGNCRIMSVQLGYHAEEKIALKNVPDQGKRVE